MGYINQPLECRLRVGMPIVLRNVYAGYRAGAFVLTDVSMEVSANTVVLGPNGSGKTTLLRTILGLSPVSRGTITIDGLDLEGIRGVPGLVATNMPEVYLPYDVPALDVARLYLDLAGGDWDRFRELVESFGVAKELHKRLSRLSAGTKVLVLDSIALASNAKYVLLDEPFESVDPARRSAVLKEVLSSRSTVLMSTHTTWLLKFMEDWWTYLIVGGRVYGPLRVGELLSSRVSWERSEDVLLEVDTGRGKIYISRSSGRPLSDLDSMDKLYEVVMRP